MYYVNYCLSNRLRPTAPFDGSFLGKLKAPVKKKSWLNTSVANQNIWAPAENVLSTTSSGCSGYPHSGEEISLLWRPEACCVGKYTCFVFSNQCYQRYPHGKKQNIAKTTKNKARFQSHSAVQIWNNAAHRFHLFLANGTEHRQQGSPT